MIYQILLYILISAAVLFIAFFLFWKLYFLRDPRRTIPTGKTIVSPADGRIIDIVSASGEITIPKRILGKIKTLALDVGEDAHVISIFMSPMDVHINRVPMDGKVVSVVHKKGSFLAVNTLEAGIQNEKCEVLLETAIGRIKFIQVAGLIARRIECWAKPGEKYKKGQRYGLINLGSQLIVILPKKVKLSVKKGDRVRAGESILARY